MEHLNVYTWVCECYTDINSKNYLTSVRGKKCTHAKHFAQ